MSRGRQKAESITLIYGCISRISWAWLVEFEVKRKRNFKAVCEPGKARNWIRLTGIVEMNRNQRLVLTAACCIDVDIIHVQS